MKFKKFIIKFLKYLFLFLFFLFSLTISYNVFFGDTIVNYGFSYAISKGEVPYNDFNLVIPLLSPFVYSFSLIFTKNIISFYVAQSLLLVVFLCLLKKVLGEKIYLLLPLIFLGFPICLFSALFPGYNFLLLFLIVLLLYLEKIDSNDYLIGLVIGLSIITKHTIGVFLILPSFIYLRRDYKKVLKRLCGLMIPCFLFFVYLLTTKSFSNFINLCIMGIFDFAKNNTTSKGVFFIICFIICFLYVIYSIIKKPKDFMNYYVLISSMFVYPLLDNYHLSYFVIMVLVLFLHNLEINIKFKNISFCAYFFCCVVSFIWLFILFNYGDYRFVNYNNYPLRLMSNEMEKQYNLLDKYINKLDKKVVLFSLGTENYFYKITNDEKITYFDLPNYGNYGYDSYEMMTERFEELDDTIIVINKGILDKRNGQQYYRELAYYVIDNYKYLDDVGSYKIYYKE